MFSEGSFPWSMDFGGFISIYLVIIADPHFWRFFIFTSLLIHMYGKDPFGGCEGNPGRPSFIKTYHFGRFSRRPQDVAPSSLSSMVFPEVERVLFDFHGAKCGF